MVTTGTSHRSLFLHIGLKKSGSSTIQTFLSDHGKALREFGVDYPLVGRGVQKAHNNFASELDEKKDFKPERGGIEDLVEYLVKTRFPTTIISSEMFEGIKVEAIEKFGEMLFRSGTNISVVLVVRNLIELMRSSYAQKIRYGQKHIDFDKFFAKRMAETRVSYYSTAENWAAVFGWENIRIRILDARFLKNGVLIDDFLNTVGVNPGQARIKKLPRQPIVNTASDWRVLEAMRALYAGRSPLPADHPLVAIMSHATTLMRRKKLERDAVRVGAEFGWEDERGLYLTRAQAQTLLEHYAESIAALNERLSEPLPMPGDLESHGFVERQFLPRAKLIPQAELMGYYDKLTSTLEGRPALARPRKAGKTSPREFTNAPALPR